MYHEFETRLRELVVTRTSHLADRMDDIVRRMDCLVDGPLLATTKTWPEFRIQEPENLTWHNT